MFPTISTIEYTPASLHEETDESEFSFPTANARRSQIAERWGQTVSAALEIASLVNPFESDLPEGVVIPAIEAMNWSVGMRNCDVRPRLVDKSSGEARLIDSGAMISAAKRRPSDKLDDSMRLVAVNGSKINTYGTREISFNIGRKVYTIQAVICDVKEDILGMDFLQKYRLGLDWDDFDQTELYLIDKKAQSKTILQVVTVPTDITRAHHVEAVSQDGEELEPVSMPDLKLGRKSNEAIAFEVACVKQLGATETDKKKSNDTGFF